MSEFHFLRPYWLLALFPIVALSWRFYRLGREGGDWRRVCDATLLPHVLIHDSGGSPARQASSLFGLGAALAIFALAGPVWERLPAPAFRNEAALVIALDLSRIMEAADIKPSRLERARFKIADILRQRKDGLTALLVYSGDAFTVTPLTDDVGTINSLLSSLTSDLMPAQGSRADLALELAGRLLKQAGLAQGDVLLMTNGGALLKAPDAAKALRSQGYRVSVLGVGSEDGAPVPLPEGGFLQDSKGNIIVSKLAAPALRALAKEGGGMYQPLSADNADVSALSGFFGHSAHPDEDGSTGSSVKIEQWEERGPWLLLPLLPIAALAFRRGYWMVAFLLVLPLPRPAQAFDWQDLWQRRDQQASQAFQSGDYAKAAEAFDNPAWKAAAQYKAGQFEEAAKTLQGQPSADAKYNLGNALAKQGHYPEALAAYDEALRLDPKHEDARYNKELIEKALQDQDQEQKKKQQPSGQGQDKQDQGGQKEPQQSDQSQGQQDGQQQHDDGQGRQDQPQPDGQAQSQQKQDGQAQPNGQRQDGQGQEQTGHRQTDQHDKEGEEQPMMDAQGRNSEEQQANEQWLKRIPDDPGGLLREKFKHQYQQRQGRQELTR